MELLQMKYFCDAAVSEIYSMTAMLRFTSGNVLKPDLVVHSFRLFCGKGSFPITLFLKSAVTEIRPLALSTLHCREPFLYMSS